MIDVKKVASLSRLKINDSEIQAYQDQLQKVIAHFEEVSQINTENVEPMVTPSQLENFWRTDEVNNSLSTQEALENAPEKSGQLFKVPPVV